MIVVHPHEVARTDKFRKRACECARQAATSSPSQGLPLSSSGKASNALSSLLRSQTDRLLIRLGHGMRPSRTISSKRDGETPT